MDDTPNRLIIPLASTDSGALGVTRSLLRDSWAAVFTCSCVRYSSLFLSLSLKLFLFLSCYILSVSVSTFSFRYLF